MMFLDEAPFEVCKSCPIREQEGDFPKDRAALGACIIRDEAKLTLDELNKADPGEIRIKYHLEKLTPEEVESALRCITTHSKGDCAELIINWRRNTLREARL